MTRRLASALLLALLLAGSASPSGDERPSRGIAVLSSTVGDEVAIEEIEAFVRTCRFDRVVVDFAWITGLWEGSDLAKIEELARRLRRDGVGVVAMYRPRTLAPADADVHYAKDEDGKISESHNLLCFAHRDSVSWAARWGERILEACPSIDAIALYNLGAACRCERCADGGAARHTAAFLGEARRRWEKIRPGVRIGHVGAGTEYAAQVDFLWPFLSVNRGDDATPVDAEALVARLSERAQAADGKPITPLAKICWASATRNTTDDVVRALAAAEGAGLGYVLWYYGWVFRPEDDRYDPAAIVRALGGDPDVLGPWWSAEAPDPRAWVWFDPRESERGPRLSPPRGDPARAEADSVLISYLADSAGGRLPRLSVSIGDTNRVLIRFPDRDLPRARRVELVLSVHLSEIPPRSPFDLAVHAVREPWAEATATWNDAPGFEAEPAAVATVEPEEGEIRIDVTKLVAEWRRGRRPNHGVLLKVVEPVSGPPPAPAAASGAGEDLLDRALALWPWASDVKTALRRAREEGKSVLAVVSAEYRPAGRTAHEDLLLSTVLSHPAVVRLGREAFVPVRVVYPPGAFSLDGARGPDPLEPLGSRVGEAKAPALLVASAQGEPIARLESIGTFAPGRILAFLSGAIGRETPTAREDEDEKAYWNAARLWRAGKREKARAALGEIAGGDGPFALKAGIRLAFPERVDLWEAIPGEPPAAEPVLAGVRYLLSVQAPDGSWPVAERPARPFVPGVTVLAAHALLVSADDRRGAERRRTMRALDRADAWLDEHLVSADPRAVNSFAAAYHLDYRLAALARRRGSKRDVEAAIRVLVAGGLENGAWSYSRRFGESWRGGFGGWPVTDRGRAHSVNTGTALLALAAARDAGFEVPEAAISGGRKALESMKKAPASFTYTWPESRNFESERASVARAPLCEQALLAVGGGDEADLRRALETFLEHRDDLERVRGLSPAWLPPHSYSGYFWFFAWYHAARALAETGDAAAKRDLARLRDDVLAIREPDGTWYDYRGVGKPYGTAMALLVLDLAAE